MTLYAVSIQVRHWVGLVSNPLGGWLARTKGIKWLLALHTGWLICSNVTLGAPTCATRVVSLATSSL